MEEIYEKLNNLGEGSVLRKSNEERKEEYKYMKIEEENKKAEEAEKKGLNVGGGLFSTEVR